MLVKKVSGFALGTSISRIFGLLREVVLAHLFGATMYMDAFRVAFNIPNLLRDELAEGSLTPSFIPIYSEHSEKGSGGEAGRFASIVITNFFFIALLISIIGIAVAPFLVKVIAFGFTGDKFSLTVYLTRIIFPFLIFVSISAIFMGILNYRERFFTTGVAPVFFNIGIIAFSWLLYRKIGVTGAAIGIVVGGFLHLLYQIIWTTKDGFHFKPELNLVHPEFLRVVKIMFPIAIGFAAGKINTIVNTLIASFLETGSISYLNYSYRLVQLPVGIIGVAIANVVLPTLSRELSQERSGTDIIKNSVKLTISVVVPLTILFFLLSNFIVKLLYEHGNFTANDTFFTASCLKFYSPAIIGFSLSRVFASIFYSMKDSKTPFFVGLVAVAINLIFALSLKDILGVNALALAVSISSCSN
ncbi:MAG: murein biosynthesis integral membrane protein MurJ, partial [candidate division WOR-3 bacterium]|nr:murein biosynthesis integral membrane protein MurJ [candidate division WOR-3 bacterium]